VNSSKLKHCQCQNKQKTSPKSNKKQKNLEKKNNENLLPFQPKRDRIKKKRERKKEKREQKKSYIQKKIH